MNFFEHQAQARSNSRRLVAMFLLAVAGVVGGLVALMLLVLSLGEPEQGARPLALIARDHQAVLAWTAGLSAGVIALASLFKTLALGRGGSAVVSALGGELVPPDSRDPQLRRLRNVVEEMAIASGVPVPAIYWLPQETGINAFAAGYAPTDAAVAVTRGALDKLTRDELQGVIGHEFSHILNGDMRLNIRMMGLLFGILVIAIAGRKLMRLSLEADDARAIAAGVAAGLAMTLVGYLGYLFGQLIRAGVSRSREYLADASSVQFTRQASGIAGALKKLSGIDKGAKLDNASREDVSHMLFGDGIGYGALFATHPPILQRIRKLEPGFAPSSIAALARTWNDPGFRIDDEDVSGSPVSALQSPQSSVMLRAAGVGAQVAAPTDADLLLATVVHRSLPHALASMAREPATAPDLLCALLLDRDATQRAAQLKLLGEACGTRRSEGAAGLAESLAPLHPSQRLPLASLAFPALRSLPHAELGQLMRAIGQLIQCDGRISLFEYCLGRLLRQQLQDLLHPAAARPAGNASLDTCADAIAVVLATLAQQGHADAATARAAFLVGSQHLLPRRTLRYDPVQDWHAALDRALEQLDQLRPMAKEMLLEALVRVLQHDGRVTVAEAELLRVICGALRCPLPPALGEP
ncbi:peptidase M48 Ste24p [Solimonas sp. K1W22B-7]|uniref:M48 family metallopeptidase n=1 Tax=Solimonas sp. K1W22B-7 TaxID=2303331 RepID=UPI000E332115|nr:M48 family metallopeptidase [Solimonas sp. K1W22B-7]AXQ27954.1 peptidase M48 Ste24p [Solimonas sp. K1W22B-7]